MLKRMIALGGCLLCVSLTLAAQKTYTIREGDTLGAIAIKFGVSESALLRANGLNDPHRLSIGQKLAIPAPEGAPSQNSSSSSSASSYTVVKGDTDWSISRKLGISVARLHELNPGVKWSALQIGAKLNVGGSVASKPAEKPAAKPQASAEGSYTVVSGDNDWVISQKLGIAVATLHNLNPGQDWTKLQIGQKLQVPGAPKPAANKPEPKKEATKPKPQSSKVAIVTANVANIRKEPSESAERVTQVNEGRHASILETRDGWYKLLFPGGTAGWIKSDLVTLSDEPPVAVAKKPEAKPAKGELAVASLLDTARSFKGTRYRYGGMSRSGVDCSGFVSLVFRKHGVKLPRTSYEQSRTGSAVSRENLKAGDLVFFKTRGSSRVNHVGIYIGNSEFIHASSGKGRVRVDTLSEGYYKTRYAGARRVANMQKLQTVLIDLEKNLEIDPEGEDLDPESLDEAEVQAQA